MHEVEKLKELIHERFDGNQASFSRAIGRQPAQVNQYLKGRRNLGIEMQMHIEKALAIPGWFSKQGHKASEQQASYLHDPQTEFSRIAVEPVHTSGKGVPLISWVTAGSWEEVSDPFQPGEADEWLPCPVRHGPRAYCLRVRGDSMHNPGGKPSYADGDIVFVDPDKAANTGDRVIVRLDDQQEATFKQLLIEDGRKILKALNPEWHPRYIEINGNATIAGVVIGKWVPE